MDSVITGCDWIIKIIERLGFPVFIAIWVLIVQQKSLNRLTEAINCLTTAVDGDRFLRKKKKRGGD